LFPDNKLVDLQSTDARRVDGQAADCERSYCYGTDGKCTNRHRTNGV